jgi:hypothetical protein
MKFTVGELHRVVANCRKFQVGKTASPMVLRRSGMSVVGAISDGYTYIEDSFAFRSSAGGASFRLALLPQDTKELLAALSPLGDSETLRLDWSFGGEPAVSLRWVDGGALVYEFPDRHSERITDFLDPKYLDRSTSPMAVKGSRFGKLDLLEPRDYPIDLVMANHDTYGDVILFKKGPDLTGALSVMDRTTLEKREDAAKILW